MGVLVGVTALAGLGVSVALASGVVTRTKTVSIPTKAKRAATAKCPKGKSVVLGGFHNDIVPSNMPEVEPIGLTRPTARSWKDAAANVFGPTAEATSIAYCGRAPKLSERTKSVQVPAATATSKPTTVTAKCPRGRRVAFGGFKADFDPNFGPNTGAIWISAMRRPSNRTWKVAGLNEGNDVGALTAVAYCGRVPRTTEHSASTVVQAGQKRSVTARCPRGQRLAFGGFSGSSTGNGAFFLIDRLVRASSRAWTAQAVNDSTSNTAGQLHALGYCR